MAAEVKYHSGPGIRPTTDERLGVARGDAVLWVRVGKNEQLRPVVLTTEQLIKLAYNCLDVLHRRMP